MLKPDCFLINNRFQTKAQSTTDIHMRSDHLYTYTWYEWIKNHHKATTAMEYMYIYGLYGNIKKNTHIFPPRSVHHATYITNTQFNRLRDHFLTDILCCLKQINKWLPDKALPSTAAATEVRLTKHKKNTATCIYLCAIRNCSNWIFIVSNIRIYKR